MPAANNHTVRFAVITDIHLSATSDSAAALATAAELRACLRGFRQKRVDFLLQLGDLIKGSDAEKHEELRQATTLLQEFPGTIRHALGNHCLAISRPELMRTLGMQAPYYAFAMQGFRFLVLDGMDVSIHNQPETEQDRKILAYYLAQPELHDYCGAIGARQKNWLQGELEGAERSGEQVIIICHFPLIAETTDARHGLLWNHLEMTKLLATSPAVKLCISGHYHYGGYALQNGIHFVVLPAFVNRTEHPGFCCGIVELQTKRVVIRNQHHETLYDLALS